MNMVRIALSALAVGVAVLGVQVSGQSTFRSAYHDYRVVNFVDGLVQPWSIAFLPGGDTLITERPGRLRIVRNGKLLPNAVEGLPPVLHNRQGGLLEVAAHPNFESNRLLYISYSKQVGEAPAGSKDGPPATTALIRARFENDRLTNVQQLFQSVSKGAGHFGGKIAFDKNGFVYLSLGDRQVPPAGDLEKHPAQDLTNHHGKMIRLHDDGKVPADNPFVKQSGALPETYSYGHRNIQGLAVHPQTGEVWANEHGPQGGDELNLIRPGLNYGWPVIGFGVNYTTGLAIHSGTHRNGMEQPLQIWVPSIGISGLMIYNGDKFPQWKGNFFVGGMAGQQVVRLSHDGKQFTGRELIATGLGRVRDLRQGLDGFIYLVIEDRDGKPTPVLRLEPVERQTR
jgi:glucose/arabinose dehydrogenase